MKTQLIVGMSLLGLGIVASLSTETTAQAKVKAANTPTVLRGKWVNGTDLNKLNSYRYITITKHWVRYGKFQQDGNNDKVVKVKKLHHYKTYNHYIYRLRTAYGNPGSTKTHYHYLYLQRFTDEGKHYLTYAHKYNKLNNGSTYFKPSQWGLSSYFS